MAQSVVDHSSKPGLAPPDDRVKLAVGELRTHHRDVRIGVQIAVSLIEYGEVGQTMNDRMSAVTHDDAIISASRSDVSPKRCHGSL
jgi:hypothetical protein